MIDWILAERLARYLAGTGDARPPSTDLTSLAAESERRVVAYTGLTPSGSLPAPEGISRRDWVSSNISSMRALLDPVLERAGAGLGPLRPAVQIAVGVVLTTEVAVVVGYLAQRVLGQYELVLLDEAADARPPRLLFVLPNLGEAVRAFGAEEGEFVTWVTLHEVTHAVQFSGVPWLQSHLAGLVRELLDGAEVRLDSSRRLRWPTRAGMIRVGDALRRGDFMSLVVSPTERSVLDRVQAVMAVIEGHAEHVMDAVAPDLLPSLPRLRDSLNRRRRSQSTLSRIVARMLGLELKLRQYEQGKIFCDVIVEADGTEALHYVFSSPGALPTLTELRDPPLWLARTSADRHPSL
ncbi:MAG TPA: zinc-dependent metalloprotease [Solirubrobacteraceae bacterium]|nr:zinc-dependent metalloprotease [Solirubrobacteraceae bacterium]